MMSREEWFWKVEGAAGRRVRELALEVAAAVGEGLLSEEAANELLAAKAAEWSEHPWG